MLAVNLTKILIKFLVVCMVNLFCLERCKRCGIVRNFEDVESGQASRLDQPIFLYWSWEPDLILAMRCQFRRKTFSYWGVPH